VTKKPLRLDTETQELISDELGMAFKIKNGIPDLTPTHGRKIVTNEQK
jgi:uncharacterized protein YbaR (Trm112 family)